MRIQTTNTATVHLYDRALMGEHYDPPGIRFNSDGVARVKQPVGEALAQSDDYPTISPYDDADSDTETSDE